MADDIPSPRQSSVPHHHRVLWLLLKRFFLLVTRSMILILVIFTKVSWECITKLLLNLEKPDITLQDAIIREVVTEEERLTATFKYLATLLLAAFDFQLKISDISNPNVTSASACGFIGEDLQTIFKYRRDRTNKVDTRKNQWSETWTMLIFIYFMRILFLYNSFDDLSKS